MESEESLGKWPKTTSKFVFPSEFMSISPMLVVTTFFAKYLEVAAGEVEIQGGIYDLETGRVEFLGKSPRQKTLLKSSAPMPSSVDPDPKIQEPPVVHCSACFSFMGSRHQ